LNGVLVGAFQSKNSVEAAYSLSAMYSKGLVDDEFDKVKALALKEVASDFVPDFGAPDPRANLNDLAGAVGKRN
jgi:hypothetical protein